MPFSKLPLRCLPEAYRQTKQELVKVRLKRLISTAVDVNRFNRTLTAVLCEFAINFNRISTVAVEIINRLVKFNRLNHKFQLWLFVWRIYRCNLTLLEHNHDDDSDEMPWWSLLGRLTSKQVETDTEQSINSKGSAPASIPAGEHVWEGWFLTVLLLLAFVVRSGKCAWFRNFSWTPDSKECLLLDYSSKPGMRPFFVNLVNLVSQA